MSVTSEIGLGNQTYIKIDLPQYMSSCEVYLWGATLTSWKQRGEERIFVSDKAIFNGVKAIRGGIPLVFPQFGQQLPTMPQHGFARTSEWTLLSSEVSEEVIVARFGLSHNEATLAVWPHEFRLEYSITLSEAGLTCQLDAHNTGAEAFTCNSLLHTYFLIHDINALTVTGFQNLPLIDKLAPSSPADAPVDERAVATIEQETDRIYLAQHGPVPPISLSFPSAGVTAGTQTLTTQCRCNLISATGEESTVPCDVVFWNPWIAKASSLADLGVEAYPKFVCVEPGPVSQWVTVSAGSILRLVQSTSD